MISRKMGSAVRPPVSRGPRVRLSSKPMRTATVMPCGSVGGPDEEGVPKLARRTRLAHHRDREGTATESVGGTAGKADHAAQPFLDQRQALRGNHPVGSRRFVEDAVPALSVTRAITCGSARTPEAMAR